jgi:23S rRNA pseudouridine1911/1915/1917 synthase
VAEALGPIALLRVRPETGRTHQIRVHLAAIGHPIVGDKVYGRARRIGEPLIDAFPRHALHAAKLTFAHPRSGEMVTVAAPLPADLQTLLAKLRQRRDLARGSRIA